MLKKLDTVTTGLLQSFLALLLFFLCIQVYAAPASSNLFDDTLWRKWEGNWAKDYLELSRYPIAFRNRDRGCLRPPIVEKGSPEAGKRIKVHLSDYPDACYTLYLPFNYDERGKWPVIFEVPGSTGLCDATHMGYGISRGLNWIWVSVPYIDKEGKIIKYWCLPTNIL